MDATDANLLAGVIIRSSTPTDAQNRLQAIAPDIQFDVDRNGTIEMRDILLVIRGIELNRLNWRRVAALNSAIQSNTWEESLLDLLSADVSAALNKMVVR